ncbi:hypothetical protein A2U01_0077706, partial [Trifolium medium]|nr:hypothetical protein [Trifolium medium]
LGKSNSDFDSFVRVFAKGDDLKFGSGDIAQDFFVQELFLFLLLEVTLTEVS